MLSNLCEKSFAVEACYSNFYAGGDIVWNAAGDRLYCLNNNEVRVVNIANGQVIQTYNANTANGEAAKPAEDLEDDDETYCFAISAEHLVTAHRSGLLRLWLLSTGQLVKLWKAQHKGPIVKVAFSACGKIICSSGGDSSLRLWDFGKSSCICVLNDFVGPATLLQFHPSVLKNEIYAVGTNHIIYCWNYESKKLIHRFRGHLSQITGLSFQNNAESCAQLTSVSRDKVVIVWQLQPGTEIDAKQLKVLPLYEELAGVAYINKGQHLSVLSINGKLQRIDVQTWKIRQVLAECDYEVNVLLHSADSDSEQLAFVTTEQNVLIYGLSEKGETLTCVKQLIGYNDEILDMCFMGADDRYLAVSTNSKHFKLYDTQQEMNCKIITGHSDTVMSVTAATAQHLLLTAGKDCSIMLWQLDAEQLGLKLLTKQESCHTSTIGCIAFAHQAERAFASVSQDGSMKIWKLLHDKSDKSYSFAVRYAALAHDKEINCVCYAPNNKIIATASQDKTAKLWHHDSNTTLGVLRGHGRGVSCVRFSPVDQIVLTTAWDSSLRIWSLSNFTCLKRLEQDSSVLRAEFIDNGKFILSAASDGLLRVWNIKTNTCLQSIDEHNERVWTLAVPKQSNKYFYSGGADSKLIRFHDITQVTRNEALDKHQAALLQEQQLQSLLHQRQNFAKAFLLALSLGKPKATYEIISQFVRERDTTTISAIIDKLNVDQRINLLEHVKAWSTNSRHSQVSNLILQHLLGDVLAKPTAKQLYNYSNMVEVLTPYVQRHFKRVTELNKELAYLEFVLKCM